MQLSPNFVAFAAFTSEIVFFALLSLNVASLAIIAERASWFWRRRVDAELLVKQALHFLKQKDLAKARAVLARIAAPECAVLLAGVNALEDGLPAAADAMLAARVRQRILMDTNLTVLKAVALAAPALGALGTLLGLVSLSPSLAMPLFNPLGVVGPAVREGLGALAVSAAGLLVGAPAAVATVLFERRVQLSLERSVIAAHTLLAAMNRLEREEAEAAAASETAEAESPPSGKKPARGLLARATGKAA